MSADNGYVIQRNSNGKFVLQMYFMSNDGYPDPDVDQGSAPQYASVEGAMLAYAQGDYYSEYGIVIKTDQIKKEKKNMQTETYESKQYDVEVVRVTKENIDEVAEWCGGEIHQSAQGTYIKVPVANPLRPRQELAFVGDRVLKSKTGFKSYTEGAFQKSFSLKEESLQELFTTSNPVAMTAEENQNIFHQAQNLLDRLTPVNPRDQISGKRH